MYAMQWLQVTSLMFDHLLVILIRPDDPDDEHLDGGSSRILFTRLQGLFSCETNVLFPNLFLDHKLIMKI